MANRIFLVATFLLTLVLLPGVHRAQNKVEAPKVTLQLSPGANNPRNSEGDFVELKDGRILYIYSRFTGNSPSDFGSSDLAARWSSDGGMTWTESDKIVVENEAATNVMSVSLLRLQSGKIALFYVRKNSIADCIPMMRTSDDEGQTWSQPTACITDHPGYYVLNNARVIQLPSGRLIAPVALHNTKEKNLTFEELEKKFNNYATLYAYYSDDQGKTWKRSSKIDTPSDVMAQEPGLIELKDGSLMMYVRTDVGMQYVSYSKDKGKTWGKAIPSNIPSPLSPATIIRDPKTGNLVLIWNNFGEMGLKYGKRTPFNIAISDNEGQTWKNIKTIHDDPDGYYCYTAARFIGKGKLLLSYCASKRAAALTMTNLTVVNTDWLYEK
jgi:sialidase-1